MRRIDYKNVDNLKKDYLEIFIDLDGMKEVWRSLRWEIVNGGYFRNEELPESIKDLLLGDFRFLATIYSKYIGLTIPKEITNRLNSLFKYTHCYQPVIANFFMEHSDSIDLSTCYYCEMAYINMYGVNQKHRNHFDLDHVLDKASCPLVALSLFNFVPSCSVCNEKLKRSTVLGSPDVDNMCKHSPTCDDYKFDERVKIEIVPYDSSLSLLKDKDKHHIHFSYIGKKDYEDEVLLFRLEERYEYHKAEAFRFVDIKNKYDREMKLKEISRFMYGDEFHCNEVREDILSTGFYDKYHRCFNKMYRDLMK